MAMAINHPGLWLLAFDVVECARWNGEPVPTLGTMDHQIMVAEVVLVLHGRGSAGSPALVPAEQELRSCIEPDEG